MSFISGRPGAGPAPRQGAADSATAPPKFLLFLRAQVVKIVGNNRTKQAYIGLTAVVKRAVGLGGWHWLVSRPNQGPEQRAGGAPDWRRRPLPTAGTQSGLGTTIGARGMLRRC
jgi:hypothetical protein